MPSDNVSGADNQQETSEFSMFYYTGFCVGEMTCSVIRASNKGKGFYFTPDFTVSNADISLLQEINEVIASNIGIISPIKGGYNLKFRGKKKVERVFQFFQRYPIVAGDIAITKFNLLQGILPAIGRYAKVQDKLQLVEQCRKDLQDLKRNGFAAEIVQISSFTDDAIGFFLAGIIDAEGSCGFKKSDQRMEPFFAVAMKDRKIPQLLQGFLSCGNIHVRSDDGLYHWEVNKRSDVLKIIEIFMNKYPSKLLKMKERMENTRRILNDYMPTPKQLGNNIV